MLKVAGVSIPKLKSMVRVPLAKVALKPRPQAGLRPILLPPHSVNHSAPSGPAVMSARPLPVAGAGYSVATPVVVIRPMLSPAYSVNHSAPSGPAAIPEGSDCAAGYSVTAPLVVMRPILPVSYSVNHSALSGPAVMLVG